MGNWKLEVVKMAVYVFMPVAMFYGYHQVDWFEEELERIARKANTKYTVEQGKMIKEAISLNRKTREKQYAEELAKLEENQK